MLIATPATTTNAKISSSARLGSPQKTLQNALGCQPASNTPTSTDTTPARATAPKRRYRARMRHCKVCGQSFTPAKNKTAKYCSGACRCKAYRQRQPKRQREARPLHAHTCCWCGLGYLSAAHNTRFCSERCRRRAYRRRRDTAVVALYVDFGTGLTMPEAADIIDTQGLASVTSYLLSRGWRFDDFERTWVLEERFR